MDGRFLRFRNILKPAFIAVQIFQMAWQVLASRRRPTGFPVGVSTLAGMDIETSAVGAIIRP